MARKLSLSDIEASRDNLDWAAKRRQNYITRNDPRNREAEAWAFIQALVDSGVELSDEDQINILNDFIRTGSATYTAPPSFDNVESVVTSTEGRPAPGPVPQRTDGLETPPLLSFITPSEQRAMSEYGRPGPSQEELMQRQADYVAKVNAGQGGYVEEGLANRLSAWWDRLAGSATINVSDILTPFERMHRAMDTAQAGPWSGVAAGSIVGENESPDQQRALASLESRFASAEAKDRVAEQVIQRTAGEYDNIVAQQVIEGLGDVAGSGSSGLSVFGGLTSALTFADVFLQEYGKARLAGLRPDQAFDAGVGQSAPEALLSIVPTAKAVRSIPGVAAGIKAIERRIADNADSALGKAANILTQTTAAAAGEGGQEGLTFMVQDAVRRYQGLVGEEKAREYALEQVVSRDEYAGELWRQVRAGILMGEAISLPGAVASSIEQGAAVADAKEQAATSLENRILYPAEIATRMRQEAEARRQQQEAAEADKADTELNLDIAREQERIREEQKAAEEDAAWEQRNLERARESNQQDVRRNLERSIDEARQDVEVLQDAVEDGARDSQTLNDLAAATRRLREREEALAAYEASEQPSTGQEAMTPIPEPAPDPEAIAEQNRLAEEQAERERQERAEQGKRIEAIRKIQEDLRKKAEADAKKEKAKQDRADKARHVKIVEELTEQYPDYTPAQLEPLVRERMEQPAPPPAPKGKTPEQELESKIRSIVGRMGRQRDAAQTKALTSRVQRYVRANPNATADEVVAAFTGQPITQPEATAPATASTAPVPAPAAPVMKAPTTPDNKLSDQEVDELASRFLGMADNLEGLRAAGQARRQAQESADTTDASDVEEIPLIPEIDMEDFRARTRQFVRGLVSRARGDSKSVQQMIWNGQLAFVPSAAAIGRNTSNVAEYDIETGQMFLYADKLQDPSDTVSAIARAFHEATHAGQFNDREGRSNLFRHFLGNGKVQKAAATIRNAAARGNAIAQRALAKAEADTRSRQGDNRFEDLEVVGYFTSEVVESRRGALGTVAGVVRDITTGAREFLRDNLGLDLDITINDLATAAANVGSEIVRTDVRGLSQNPNVLGMIYNVNPDRMTEGQRTAIDNGWVYESVDGTQKFVLSDHDATLKPGAAETLRSARGATRLADVIDHPVLFAERESSADLPVYAVSEVIETARGMYDPGNPAIYVKEDLLNNPEELKGVLLHEVQHYVQDIDGRSGQFYDGNEIIANQARLLEELTSRVNALDSEARRLLDVLPNMLPVRERGRLLRELMRNSTDRDTVNAAVARDFVEGLENIPQEAADAIARYEKARQNYSSYLPQYRAAVAQAHNNYLANITESEAHFVQDNAEFDTSGVNPEPEMRERVGRQLDVPAQESPVESEQYEAAVLGMAAVDQAAGNYSPPNSPAFREWFGNSQIKDARGNPQVYYHGTKHYFDTFRTNELGLIFASPDRMFAEAFAGMDNGGYQREAIPLYIRAENPWDFDNDEHIESLLNSPTYDEGFATVRDFVHSYYSSLSPDDAEAKLKQGDWSLIETPIIIEAIKDMGHDSLFVYEPSAKNIAVFTPNQLKHATDNKGAWSREDDSFLGMRTATSDAPASTGNAARSRVTKAWITSTFRNDKGLGEQVLNWIELSKSSPAYDSMAAEAKLRDYQIGLEELARERGTDVRTISNEIADKLDELAKDTNKYSENKAAWAKVLADYGKAGEALMDMRNRADALTTNILQLREQQGGDLTPAEQKAYKAMAANLGRYVHRMYAAGSGKAGRKYSQAMWNAHMKSRNPKANMTTAEKHNAAVVQRALKVLADDLTIPDEMTLLQMDRPAVSNLYDTWVGTSSEGLDIVEMADRLLEVRDGITPERINNQAEQIAKELLGLLNGDVTTPLGKFYRGNKLDRGILQQRKQIDPAIRELMGEIRDPGVALLGTVGKQAEFVARQKLMLQLRSVVGRDLQPPSATGSSIVLDNNMQRLEGPDFGALEGWYASPNMKLALDSTAQHLVTLEQALANMGAQPDQINEAMWAKLREGWMKTAGFTKATSILGNPILFGINFVGSFDTMLMNGNYTSPTTQLRALKEAGELIAYAVNPSISSESTRLLAKYGVIDSAQIGELKNMNYKQIQDHIRSLIKQDGKRRKLLNFGRGAVMGWKEAYAMMDVWAKIANFHQNVNDIKAYNEAEGKGWTQEEIYERAAAATKRLNISYQRAAPFIKALERGGITMFGTYFYETFRVQVENIAEVGRDLQAAKDATTPEGRNVMLGRATKRALGILASNAMKYVLAKKFSELVFGDDEDKWYNMRGLLPEFLQNQDFIPVGKDKDGHIVVFPISRLDPMGPNTDIIREIIHGDGDPKKVVQQLLDLYIAPRIAGSVIAQVTGKGREPTFQQVAPGVYAEVVNATGGRARVVKALTNIAETALPGIVNAYRSNNASPIPTDPASQVWAYTTYLGNRLYKIDPNESAKFAGFAYSNFDKAAKDEIREYFKSQTDPTVEDVQRVVTRIVGEEKSEWDKLRRMYLGMEGFGMSKSDRRAVLEGSPIPKAVQTTVANGVFVPNTVSVRSLETYRNNIIKGKSRREKEELEKKWNAMIDTLTQVLQDE